MCKCSPFETIHTQYKRSRFAHAMSNPYVVKSLQVDAPTIFIRKLIVLIHDSQEYDKLYRQNEKVECKRVKDDIDTNKQEMSDMLASMFKFSSSTVFRFVEHMHQLIRTVTELDQLTEKEDKYMQLEADMKHTKKVLSSDLSTLVKIATNN